MGLTFTATLEEEERARVHDIEMNKIKKINRQIEWINTSVEQLTSSQKIPDKPEEKFDIRFWNTFTETEKAIILESGLRSTDVYANVLIVNLCIRIIQTSVMSLIPAIVLKDKNNEKVESNPIEKLLFKKPNEIDTPSEIMSWYATDMKLAGNCYLKISSANLNPQGNPGSVDPLFARYCEPIPGNMKEGEGYIKSYKYDPGGGIEYIEPKKIIHIKNYNYKSRIHGMSDIEAMASEIDRVDKIDRHQRLALDKGIFPNVNVHTDQNPTKEQRTELMNNMREQYSGPSGEKIFFTWHGFEIKPLSLSPADLQLLESERFTGAMIANALGVPGLIISSFIGKDYVTAYKEAHRQLLLMTTIPLVNRYLEKINAYFFQEDDIRFALEHQRIPDLRIPVEELSKMYWFTPNEKRVMQGSEPLEDKNMDKIYIPSNYLPIDSLSVEERQAQ